MSKILKTVKGMRDYLKEDKKKLDYIINIARNLFDKYTYNEVSTPILEPFELLSYKAGDEIREKMYVFEDKAQRLIALRPEMTAPIARLYINSLMKSSPKPVRLGYIGTCYRYDNPQMGRYREFWQAGYELFGSDNPESDIEILNIAYDLITKLKFKNFKIRIGHIGIFRSFLDHLKIEDKIQDKIMGLLDLKMEEEVEKILNDKKIPAQEKEVFYEFLKIKEKNIEKAIDKIKLLFKGYDACSKSINNFIDIMKIASELDLQDKLEVDMSLARGLEYYTGMIFEIFIKDLNIAVGGGGRYDKLIEVFGGISTPAVGFAAGLDRLILAMDKTNLFKISQGKKILVVPLSTEITSYVFKIASKLRAMNISIDMDVLRRNIKRAIKFAIENHYDFVILIGEKEKESNMVTIKNICSQEQFTVKIEDVKKILGDY